MHYKFRFFNMFDEVQDTKTQDTKTQDPKPADQKQNGDVISKAEYERALNTERENSKKVLQELELLKTRDKMTKEERAAQDKRLQELENKVLSTEELSKREKAKLEKARLESETTLTRERDHWKSLYSNERIVRSIKDAAIEHEAINPEQMVALLQRDTKIVEMKTDDGNVNGYEVLVTIPVKSKETGVVIPTEFTVSKALAHMKEESHNFNLFKSAFKSGFGGAGGRPNVHPSSEAEIAKDGNKWKEHSRQMRGKVPKK
jgi:hypothetical protein